MPATLTYPGVYIEEIPSGVRTITGVATSITAFIGRALRGPVNGATTINSFGDYERTFGGLWLSSKMSFAVRDFFLNGGSQAVIVRLYHSDGKDKATLTIGAFKIDAAYEGAWGNNLKATVDVDTTDAAAKAIDPSLTHADLFNLTLKDTNPGGAIEVFRNLTVKDTSQRIDRVLAAQSNLARWDASVDLSVPPAIAAGDDDPTKLIKADDGADLTSAADYLPASAQANKVGLYALEQVNLFNILCIPPYSSGDVDSGLIGTAAAYCETRRAMFLVDPPAGWTSKANALSGVKTGVGTTSKNAALYFPRLRSPNPINGNLVEDFVPCGAVAGIYSRTDTQRGVWKAPAGLDASLVGVPNLSVPLTDPENGELNPLGVNCLRSLPAAGRVVWGARTLQGDDRLASEWKYVPVRRLALYLEESLYRGTQWVVFEPNDEPLWSQIRLNVGAFMQNLFRQGAFQGTTPTQAYFVKCDKETTTQNDINLGIVNIVVGFAPLKPAEFVVLQIQQMAGQVAT